MDKNAKALKMVVAMIEIAHSFEAEGRKDAARVVLNAAQDLPADSLARLFDIIKEA